MHSERTRKVGNVKDIFQEGNKLKQKIFALAMASAMIVSLFAGCGGSSGQTAVSYTHLDVYKRQPLAWFPPR